MFKLKSTSLFSNILNDWILSQILIYQTMEYILGYSILKTMKTILSIYMRFSPMTEFMRKIAWWWTIRVTFLFVEEVMVFFLSIFENDRFILLWIVASDRQSKVLSKHFYWSYYFRSAQFVCTIASNFIILYRRTLKYEVWNLISFKFNVYRDRLLLLSIFKPVLMELTKEMFMSCCHGLFLLLVSYKS